MKTLPLNSREIQSRAKMTIEEKRDQLVEELSPFEDPFERFAYVIDRAKGLEPLSDEYKIDTFLIKGCISQLWVFPSTEEWEVLFQSRLRRLHHQRNRRSALRTLQWRNTRKHHRPRTRLSRRGRHHPTPLPQPSQRTDRSARKNQVLRPTLSRQRLDKCVRVSHNLNPQCQKQRPFPYCLHSFISAPSRPNPSMFSSARVDAEPRASTTPPSTRTTENSLPPSWRPRWLARLSDSSSQWKILYSVGRWEGGTGAIGYQISGGELKEFTRMACSDGGGCHIAVHPSGKFLLTAQYGGGSVALFPLDSSGKLGEPTVTEHEGGSKVVERRQESPHPHWTGFPPMANTRSYPTSVSTKS